MIRTFIIDDHPLVREGLKQILSESSEMVVAGEGGFGRNTLNKINRNKHDVIILDAYFSGIPVLDFLKEIKSSKPDLPVLVLNMKSEKDNGLRFLRAGASGCLAKDCEADELKEAVREVSKGRMYISPSLAEKIALSMITNGEQLQHEKLSRREFEVMLLIAGGKSLKEIAQELSLSAKTISVHRANIMKKMEWKNNVELTCYVI
ncbi:MAG: response regulator transcription factor, partial [Candidatus Aminicenantes bacterium]|nr:response regulator transcription factor [Candidatus Aminicenantes bacterium]